MQLINLLTLLQFVFQCGAGAAHTLLLAADDDDESKEILKKLDVNDD